MRREGHIIEEIVAYPNMAQSFDQVLRGTTRKRSRQGRYLLAHREEVIAELSAKIADGSYTIENGYRERTIIEGGKERHIHAVSVHDLEELWRLRPGHLPAGDEAGLHHLYGGGCGHLGGGGRYGC